MSGRTAPFKGFSRKEPEGPPPGRHFYHVAYVIQRPGEMPRFDNGEGNFPGPIMTITQIRMIQDSIADDLVRAEPDKPRPEVVVVSYQKLAFVSNEVLERAEAEAAKEAKEAEQATATPAADGGGA